MLFRVAARSADAVAVCVIVVVWPSTFVQATVKVVVSADSGAVPLNVTAPVPLPATLTHALSLVT